MEQLCLLYDGAMAGARMDGSADAAGHALTAACSLLDSAVSRS
ncbi:hypothetical protein [Pseudonocardia oceani]|nr:hypothetical protein [Pseudonocardia oceani]